MKKKASFYPITIQTKILRQLFLIEFIKMHPFVNFEFIRNRLQGSKNRDDLIADLNFLINLSVINKVLRWGKWMYCPIKFENSFQESYFEHLQSIQRFLSEIDSSFKLANSIAYKKFLEKYKSRCLTSITKTKFDHIGPMFYHKGLQPAKPMVGQILHKILNIYYIKTKIILIEDNRNDNSSNVTFNQIQKKLGRVNDLGLFLKIAIYVLDNLENYSIEKIAKIVARLDEEYHFDRHYYNWLVGTGRPFYEIIRILRFSLYEPKRQIADELKITLKDLNYLLNPLLDKYGRPDIEKLRKLKARFDGTSVENVSDLELTPLIHYTKINPKKREPRL